MGIEGKLECLNSREQNQRSPQLEKAVKARKKINSKLSPHFTIEGANAKLNYGKGQVETPSMNLQQQVFHEVVVVVEEEAVVVVAYISEISRRSKNPEVTVVYAYYQ